MHTKNLFVDAASDSGLQPILAGPREVARAAARRRSVLPSLPGDGASSVSAALDAASGTELLPEAGVSAEELYRNLGRLSEGAALALAVSGGPLRSSRRRRSLVEGIERADSVTVNPQKWLYVANVCALALFSDRAVWQRAVLLNSFPDEETINRLFEVIDTFTEELGPR